MTWRICECGLFYFYFLTDWNWTFNLIYFVTGALECLFTSKRIKQAHRILFSISQPISWFVFIFFWTILSGQFAKPNLTIGDRIDLVVAHALNLLFTTVDLFLSKTTVTKLHFLAPILATLVYMATVVFVHLTSNVYWPYEFLEIVNGGKKDGIIWINSIICCFVICSMIASFLFWVDFLVGKRDSKFAPKNVVEDVEMQKNIDIV